MNILVVGFYHKFNIGDDLFIDSFKELFPKYNFTFTNVLTKELLYNKDALFIGGGSFLYNFLNLKDMSIDDINLPIFYIGVGTETEIHSQHKKLMSRAQLVATRSDIESCKQFCNNVIKIPDLVFALKARTKKIEPVKNSILFIPNFLVVPSNADPLWKFAAWSYFKSEISQLFDHYIQNKYSINYLSMCTNSSINDAWAAIEIMNSMKYKKLCEVKCGKDIEELSGVFSKHDIIITQRFHGIVLSELVDRKYIAIHHHDKLKNTENFNGMFKSFYEFNKNSLIDMINIANNYTSEKNINNFEDLKYQVASFLDGNHDAICGDKKQ